MAVLAVSFFAACENDDVELIFTAQDPSEAVTFSNNFADEYLLSNETSSNNAETFVWTAPDFGAQTPISYIFEGSTDQTFGAVEYDSGTLGETNHSVRVSTLLTMAETLGLDADPATTDGAGEPNNTGTVYFRVRAFIGDDGATAGISSTSDPIALNITLIEATGDGGSGVELSSWGIVGSAANDWGATPDLPFYTTDAANVFVAYANLINGEIKFRENNDWANNFGDTGADGTLDAGGDNIAVTAGDYKITINLNDNTYTIEAFSIGIVGSAWNDWGNAGPDAKLFYDYTTNTFKVGVKLLDGEMKLRLNNDWGTNYGDDGADGTLELNGANIVTTAGFYMVTMDMETLAYTVEATDIWGVVGSGYNDWGNAGPDASFTELAEGVWFAENVTLVDGEIKFRVNEDWGNNIGDDGADGTLEANGANIVVTAGVYDITLNFNDNTYTIQ